MFEQVSLHERRILTKVEHVQSSLAGRKDKKNSYGGRGFNNGRLGGQKVMCEAGGVRYKRRIIRSKGRDLGA